MKLSPTHLASLLLLGMLSPSSRAQDKPKPEEKPKSEAQTTPIKVTIVFTEYDGDKKIKSLPYTLYINAPDSPELKGGSIGWTRIRTGSKVPVYTGKDQIQYFDVGTNIDVRAVHSPDGRFLLGLNLERSWVEGDVAIPVTKSDPSQPEALAGHFREPVIRQFRSEFEMKLRETQVLESTMATDPLSGKVLRVEVSVAIVK